MQTIVYKTLKHTMDLSLKVLLVMVITLVACFIIWQFPSIDIIDRFLEICLLLAYVFLFLLVYRTVEKRLCV